MCRLCQEPHDLPAAPLTTTEILAFSPDSKTLAAGSDSVIRLWDAESGKQRPAGQCRQ